MHAWASAAEIAGAIADGKSTAVAVVEAALQRISKRNGALNAFTAVTDARGYTTEVINCRDQAVMRTHLNV